MPHPDGDRPDRSGPLNDGRKGLPRRLVGGWRILHSSRSRNGVQEDDVQAVEHLRESFAGAKTFLSG